jgi:hypothetical protein
MPGVRRQPPNPHTLRVGENALCVIGAVLSCPRFLGLGAKRLSGLRDESMREFQIAMARELQPFHYQTQRRGGATLRPLRQARKIVGP